jgi:signal transduction histidine kinase
VFMGVINRQADRLLKLVQEVLQASRMESAQPRLNREQCDLADIAHDVISGFSHTILGDGRRIAFEATPKRPHTWGDPVALEQIFTNLIENALKYSAGDVTVIVSESESETTIEVADSGVGMTPEQLETVFERYRQIDVPAHAGGSGFGLGLFITRNLVDAHNGTIEVLSEPGAGSCFIVHLPKRTTDG